MLGAGGCLMSIALFYDHLEASVLFLHLWIQLMLR